jgi:hypothetical protein
MTPHPDSPTLVEEKLEPATGTPVYIGAKKRCAVDGTLVASKEKCTTCGTVAP